MWCKVCRLGVKRIWVCIGGLLLISQTASASEPPIPHLKNEDATSHIQLSMFV